MMQPKLFLLSSALGIALLAGLADARADEPAPAAGALTLEPSPYTRFFRALVPAAADAREPRLSDGSLELGCRTPPDSFSHHDAAHAGNDHATARPERTPFAPAPTENPQLLPASEPAATPWDFSPFVVAPNSASARSLEPGPAEADGWTYRTILSGSGPVAEMTPWRVAPVWNEAGFRDAAGPAGRWTAWAANPEAGRASLLAALAAVGPQPQIVSYGTYTSLANATTTATGQSTTFSNFANPVLSGDNVAFYAYYNSYNSVGIFTGTVGTKGAATIADYTTVAAGQTTTFSSLNPPVLSGSNVAFLANFNAGASQGIFTGTVGVKGATTVADYTTVATGQTMKFSGFGSTPTISGSNLAFYASYNAGNGRGVFTGTAGIKGAATIADYTTVAAGQTTAFNYFPSTPVLSDSNLAFLAYYSGGTGVFTGTVGTEGAVTVADTVTTAPGRGLFSNFSSSVVSISGSNIAFLASSYVTGSSGATGRGIYLYQNGTLADIVTTGEPLFGSTISALSFSSSGLDGNSLTYYYSLANGISGIATTVVPEPATWLAGALLLGAAGLGLRRRRTRW